MLVVMALALMPSEVRMPSTGWDKSDHLLAFFVIALLGGGRGLPRSNGISANRFAGLRCPD
jgi:hypothetical protein